MAFKQRTSRLLATALTLVVYVFILLSVFATDQPQKLPEKPSIVNVSEAWADLHVIASRPHPYNSHANDLIRIYLLSRIQPIVDAHPHVHLVDDLQSNGSWSNSYFEGTNILVKIDGTDADADAVLFSAHYDSVSTSTGATDDGMAIVTLLQLVAKFAGAKHRRTAIFNFNNGEEDGLQGANAFFRHPWSNLTTTFLNLEGAASGGRPILFRGTSSTPLRAFLPSHVPHPHTNVLAAEAFERGVIRSQTDYVVYAADGHMQGLDLAFYKGRSRYHTRYDAIPWLEGGERALWAMMETADGAGGALLNQQKNESGDGAGTRLSRAVYFDLFGGVMVLFSLEKLRVYNIVFLATVPIGTILLFLCQHLAATREWGVGRPKFTFDWPRFWAALLLTVAAQTVLVLIHLLWNPYIVYSSAYLVVLSALSLAFLTLLLPLSARLPERLRRRPSENPSTTTSVLLQLHILAYILLLLPTAISPTPLGGTYLLSALATCVFAGWAVGIIAEIALGRPEERANASENLTERAEEAEDEGGPAIRFEPPPTPPSPVPAITAATGDTVSQSHDQSQNGGLAGTQIVEEAEMETEPTETTPLMSRLRRHHRHVPRLFGRGRGVRAPEWLEKLREYAPELIWVLQMLIVVPLPVILFAHVVVLLVGSTSQSVVDGGPVWIVYAGLSAISVLLLLPLAPFFPSPPSSPPPETDLRDPNHPDGPTPDTNFDIKPITILAGAIFLMTAAYLSGFVGLTLTPFLPRDQRPGFPFSVEDPLKVFFDQKVEVLPGWSVPRKSRLVGRVDANDEVETIGLDASGVRAYTYLTGVPWYLQTMILPTLPSVRRAEAGLGRVDCVKDEARTALVRCGWQVLGEMLPVPGGDELWDGHDENDERATGVSGIKDKTLVLGKNPWLKSSVTRGGGERVRIKVKGRNTRACRVYFDGGVKVKKWRVLGGSEGGSDEDGEVIHMVRLWSRTWGREFVLDVELEEGKGERGKELSGRVACEWVEYESGLVGVGNGEGKEGGVGKGGDGEMITRESKGGKIPAYEEALKFFPRWAVTTKVADGLVEVWSAFKI